MSAHVLLNLLNKLGKVVSLFRNKFNKFNNTGARLLNSLYHMTLKLYKNHIFDVKSSRLCQLLCSVIMDVIK